MKGILLVDKPSGMTSHDVVDAIRRAAGTRRVGHTGTLDPAATGLLILCIGAATRLSEFLTRLEKVYEGTMRLGVVTDSYDLDGEVVAENAVPDLAQETIQAACDEFTGEILQEPPMVSAVKVGGQRLYKLARKGETVERKPRPVTVHEFQVLGLELPDVRFRVRCSSGTYARSLCHDVGQKLGCGATLANLRRTAVGQHRIEDARPLDALATREAVLEHLRPIETALDLPEVCVKPARTRLVSSGGELTANDIRGACPVTNGWVQVKTESGDLLALAEVSGPKPSAVRIQPKRVFVDAP